MGRPKQLKPAKRTTQSCWKLLVHSKGTKLNYVAYFKTKKEAESVKKRIGKKDFSFKLKPINTMKRKRQ